MSASRDLDRLPAPWIVAHRGASAHHPENTWAAFEAAVHGGAGLIELDVHATADGVFVALHDATLDRTTSGHGAVRSRSWAELRDLDAGSWFGPEHAGARIPRLDEVLERLGGRVLLNLELKGDLYEPTPRTGGIEAFLAERLQALGLEGRVLVSSFEHAFLPRFEACGIPFGLLYDGPFDGSAAAAQATEGDAFACLPEAAHVTRDELGALVRAGVPVIPYTVDDPLRAAELVTWGAHGLVTNDPAGLAAALEGR